MTVEAIPAWDPEHCAALDRFSGLQNNVLSKQMYSCRRAGKVLLWLKNGSQALREMVELPRVC